MIRSCHCCYHLASWPDAVTNFYNDHFVPTHWELRYFKLSECKSVCLVGHCKDCNGTLEVDIPLPKGLAGDDLLKAIYDTVQTAHPHNEFSERAGYYGGCEERDWFYADRDKCDQFQRSQQFLELFKDWSREQVRLWLEKNFPPEKHTEVFRDTGGSLFSSVIRQAKENGDFEKVEAILDYTLPCERESGTDDKVLLTAYEFDFVPILNYGCEGIYIDCYLKGKFDESERSSIHVGTLKTLRRDLESAQIMGELCGSLMHHAFEYVNRGENLHRYTPAKQLESEYQRQLEKKNTEEGGTHE